MWERGRNRANPGMVPAWGKSSSNRGLGSSSSLCKTHGRTALSSSRGDGGRKGHNSYGGGSGRGRRNSGDGRARVRPAGRGRRGAAHLRSEAMSSACLHHSWAREVEERMGWGGGGGGVLRLKYEG